MSLQLRHDAPAGSAGRGEKSRILIAHHTVAGPHNGEVQHGFPLAVFQRYVFVIDGQLRIIRLEWGFLVAESSLQCTFEVRVTAVSW